MVSLTLIAVGLLAATAVVIALARGSTARWEQDKRAAAAVRADVSAGRTSPAGSAHRIPSALARPGVALRSQASRFLPVKAFAQLLPKGMKLGTSSVRPIRRLVGALRSSLLVALAPKPSRAATDIRSDGVADAAERKLVRRTAPRARRRALAILHRHEDPRDARIPDEGTDETPTAR